MSHVEFITLNFFCSWWEKWKFPGCGSSQSRHMCLVRQTVSKYISLNWLQRKSEEWLISYRLVRSRYLPSIFIFIWISWILLCISFLVGAEHQEVFLYIPQEWCCHFNWRVLMLWGRCTEFQKISVLIYLLESSCVLLFILHCLSPVVSQVSLSELPRLMFRGCILLFY